MSYLVIKIEVQRLTSGFPCKDSRINVKTKFFKNKEEANQEIRDISEFDTQYLNYYLIESKSQIKLEKIKFK
jgi:hypothetical protein